MADEVIIGNVGGTDGVASEATLQALVRAIEKMGARSGQTGKGAKVQDLHNKALEQGTTATNNQTRSVEDNTDAVKDSTDAAKGFARTLGDLAGFGIGQVLASLGGMTKSLLEGEDSLEAYASQIPIVGSLLGAMAGYLDRSMDAFREMSSVGAAFNNDILAMRRMAAENNLTLDEFRTVVTQNSAALSALGGTVTGGVQRFTAMNRALKDTGTFEQLQNMGFSIIDINEGMADYVSLQSRLGRLQGKSTQELAAGSANYLKELDQLAKITGKSRKELAAEMERNAADAGFRALQNQFKEGSVEFENFRKNMALIDTLPADIATGLKDLADGIPQTEEGIALINAAGPEIADAMKRVGEGADPQVMLDAFKKAGGDMEKFAGMEGAQRAAFIASLRQTNPALAGVLDGATKLIELGNKDIKKAEEEQKKRAAITEKLTQFQNAIREMSEAIQVAFIDSGLLELFAEGVKQFAELITGAADSIREFTETMKSEGFLSALGGLIGDAIVGLFSNASVVAALVGGIGALFVGKAALGAMSRAMSGMADKVVSKAFGGGGPASQAAGALGGAAGNAKPSQAGKGFGQAIANISKGIGQGVGAVLKGLATGLKAFANPQILVGAGILGGAITLIGAGIAGATWLLGKALPTFVEGLSGFDEIDGGNLLKVAGGITALSVAMAALGAGRLVGAVTGALGGLAEGIVGFFGGSSALPLDKIKEFGELNLNAKQIEENAKAVAAFGRAMQLMPEIKGNRSGGVIGAIADFFLGAEQEQVPWAQVAAFGNVVLPTANIKANAEAVVAFSNAIKSLPEIKRERTGGVIGAIADFFHGAEQNAIPWAQVAAFGQVSIPAEKIKTNAEALAAFGEALSKMPEIKKTSSGGVLGAISDFFFGPDVEEMPWQHLTDFGNLKLRTANIKTNSEALAAFGEALSKFNSGAGTTATIPPEFIDGLEELMILGSENSSGLQQTADGLQAIANIKDLSSVITPLTELDASKVTSFSTAIRDLASAIAKLNEELSKDNDGGLFGFGGSDKANAGDLLKNISLNTNAGAGNTDQLNSTMVKVLEILRQMKDLNDKIEKNTKSLGGSDISGRGITRY